MPSTIAILGACGNTGRQCARLLLDYTDVRLRLLGRTESRLHALATELGCADRLEIAVADAADGDQLATALDSAEIALIASSTACYASSVARACIAAGCDYVDTQYSTSKLQALMALQPKAISAGRCLVTDAGYHPGLPGALVRWAAGHLTGLQSAIVSSAIHHDWSLPLSPETRSEFVSEMLQFQSCEMRDGEWHVMTTREMMRGRIADFAPFFGPEYVMPMMLEEMRGLREEIPTLRETGFYLTGFNWLVDWVLLPIGYVVLRLWPRAAAGPLSAVLLRAAGAFPKHPPGVVMTVEASDGGSPDPTKVRLALFHADGYSFTAIPVVACLRQMLDGVARAPGLHFMARIVDPERLLRDMVSMGVRQRVECL